MKQKLQVSFTGTAKGMTDAQKKTFKKLIIKLDPYSFNHGDCVGSDSEACNIVYNLRTIIICHPPLNNYKRAFTSADQFRLPKPYLERNKDIVDEGDILIATPKGFKEELRSGTWATIRYAKKLGRKICIIYPNGDINITESRYSEGVLKLRKLRT